MHAHKFGILHVIGEFIFDGVQSRTGTQVAEEFNTLKKIAYSSSPLPSLLSLQHRISALYTKIPLPSLSSLTDTDATHVMSYWWISFTITPQSTRESIVVGIIWSSLSLAAPAVMR